ncbi:NUDIX hydrolase [[Leptolyngbya] sp. PCC 7376]|uniref:NUDIX domain-containing protein n=1 Tax=[Leptolyngbya] sp. PCC 7376 TaxID=111781 RepID=UPI00029F4A82|nr:NUDIX hydrolase [[Leptolyngbya] sp. PCC 7376]AFY37434.1 NUDIX hydrolase [[Leptolyngbya] sp. PCC 7376]
MNIWRFIAAGLKLLVRHPIVGTTLIPILPDGKIVLARRRDTGTWSLPGGILDWGEDLTSCSRRELLEETGFELIKISRLVGVYSSLGRDPRFHAVTVAIAVEVNPSSTTIQDADEILEVKPFEASAMPLDNLSHDHAQLLCDYFDGKTVVA